MAGVVAAAWALVLLGGVGTAFAQTEASDAPAARAARFAATHSALGLYFDAVTGEQVVVVPRRSAVTRSQVARVVGKRSRVERRGISAATVQSIQRRVAGRAFDAGDYTYASYLDLATGKVVLRTDAPPALTAGLSKAFPGVIDRRPGGPQDDLSRRADLAPFWGRGRSRATAASARPASRSSARPAAGSWSPRGTASESAPASSRPAARPASARWSSAARSRRSTWS